MRIGFISTRFQGTDGVSLEASKWAKVLEKDLGHECFWFAGKLDTPEKKSLLCTEAFFGEEDVISLHEKLFEPDACISNEVRSSVVEMESYLKSSLENFLRRIPNSVVNKRMIESLIKCGALDSLFQNRNQLLQNIDSIISFCDLIKREKTSNQNSLFAHDEENKFKIGDKVSIRESKPFSKNKKFEVIGDKK